MPSELKEEGLTESAIRIRLETLRRHGLVNRERVGGHFYYFRTGRGLLLPAICRVAAQNARSLTK